MATVILLAVAALSLAFQYGPELDFKASGLLAFSIAGLALELSAHRMRSGTATASIGFIVFLGSALVFGPPWGALITCLCIGGAQVLNRKRPLRIAFNVAQHGLALLAGAGVYQLLGGHFPPEHI